MLNAYVNDKYFALVNSSFLEQIKICLRDVMRFAAELFAQSATDNGLSLWEAAYGLEPQPGETTEERRAALLAKLRYDGSFTRSAIDEIVRSIVDDYTLTEEPNKVIINCKIFDISDMQKTLAKLRALLYALETIKPAHVTLEITNDT